jgi:hypothetical protein
VVANDDRNGRRAPDTRQRWIVPDIDGPSYRQRAGKDLAAKLGIDTVADSSSDTGLATTGPPSTPSPRRRSAPGVGGVRLSV